jgi:hypothetical protein
MICVMNIMQDSDGSIQCFETIQIKNRYDTINFSQRDNMYTEHF